MGKKIAPEIRFLGDTCSQAGDVYAYGHILEELSIIRCKPAEQTSTSDSMQFASTGLMVPKRPLRISNQWGLKAQDNNTNFIKVDIVS